MVSNSFALPLLQLNYVDGRNSPPPLEPPLFYYPVSSMLLFVAPGPPLNHRKHFIPGIIAPYCPLSTILRNDKFESSRHLPPPSRPPAPLVRGRSVKRF